MELKSKFMLTVIYLAAAAVIFTACTANVPTPTPSTTNPPAANPSATNGVATTDTVSGASRVVDEADFEQKVSKENTNFMVIPSKDLTFTKDITVESGIKEGSPNRALGFGTYKEDKTVDKRFTLTVPRLIIAGENVKFEYGIIKGDVYVTGAGFNIKDCTIDGNLYFATEELKSAFKLDEASKITGNTEVKAI